MTQSGLGLMELLGVLGMSVVPLPQLGETVLLHLRVELLALIVQWKDFTFVRKILCKTGLFRVNKLALIINWHS